ncbi:MAG: phosphate/phosphite/phosphonate ABC transporter substrate-binding protein [Magnetococcales bacterium]|nr:phosphate/phosphite/phosphonate ABC transporter substrate-binding protein [Magnetococcales bacterium]
MRNSFVFIVFLVLQILTTSSAVGSPVVYKFGVVPQFEPRKLSSIWRPILDALEERTGYKFRMTGSPQIPDFEGLFMSGEFDFAYMNPYHSVLAAKKQGYIPLVRDNGVRLFGVLTVKKDSGVTDIKQLAGKTIAFPAPNALGASLLMRADLIDLHGIDFKPKYVKTHSSVYLNVALGLADAGGGVMGTLNQQKKTVKDSLSVIYKTRTMSPHPVTAHPRVDPIVRERVKNAFLELGKTEHGAFLLRKVPIKKVGPASISDYEEITQWGLDRYYKSPR